LLIKTKGSPFVNKPFKFRYEHDWERREDLDDDGDESRDESDEESIMDIVKFWGKIIFWVLVAAWFIIKYLGVGLIMLFTGIVTFVKFCARKLRERREMRAQERGLEEASSEGVSSAEGLSIETEAPSLDIEASHTEENGISEAIMLARQTHAIDVEFDEARLRDSFKVLNKMDALTPRVDKLSAEDKKAYKAERERLKQERKESQK
jgi:hypothetical protein